MTIQWAQGRPTGAEEQTDSADRPFVCCKDHLVRAWPETMADLQKDCPRMTICFLTINQSLGAFRRSYPGMGSSVMRTRAE